MRGDRSRIALRSIRATASCPGFVLRFPIGEGVDHGSRGAPSIDGLFAGLCPPIHKRSSLKPPIEGGQKRCQGLVAVAIHANLPMATPERDHSARAAGPKGRT